ncbi:hypothetical protein TSOC_006448 [Tetrabaena socialis]|uniref:Uncharacterized protein n=1 Tax=Tetrabaena socialis TaxID=47790 RepID=A0A2J8A3L4_9CHLO|nr:hypothetical protein TSOC_006448 [Tetrabaena socialis]|eukprot:PNH07110.1 hypothetical protein TSOC_006448 [Tetrabaena socialis]
MVATTAHTAARSNSLPTASVAFDDEPPSQRRLDPAVPGDGRPFSPSATFSPVFDLELSTPTPPPKKQHLRGLQHDLGRAPGPDAAARRQLLHQRAATGAPAAAVLDRSRSDLQVLLVQHHGDAKGAAALQGLELHEPAQRLLELCKPCCELELQLSRRLRAFRNARVSKAPSAPAALAPLLPAAAAATAATAAGAGAAAAAAAMPDTGPASSELVGALVAGAVGTQPPPTSSEIEALAAALLFEGYLVHARDGTRHSRDARACLRTLKHRFLVCLGWAAAAAPRQHEQLQQQQQQGQGQREQQQQQQQHQGQGQQQGQQQQQEGQELERSSQKLREPLVVEPRFREQFLIANPTRDYERLLMVRLLLLPGAPPGKAAATSRSKTALPVVFVGPLRRLDAVVALMAEAAAEVFRGAGRPLPPWRTKDATLSKWAPEQLLELERMMRQQADAPEHPDT